MDRKLVLGTMRVKEESSFKSLISCASDFTNKIHVSPEYPSYEIVKNVIAQKKLKLFYKYSQPKIDTESFSIRRFENDICNILSEFKCEQIENLQFLSRGLLSQGENVNFIRDNSFKISSVVSNLKSSGKVKNVGFFSYNEFNELTYLKDVFDSYYCYYNYIERPCSLIKSNIIAIRPFAGKLIKKPKYFNYKSHYQSIHSDKKVSNIIAGFSNTHQFLSVMSCTD